MRDKITRTKHYVSVTVSNLASIADTGASAVLPCSVQAEKGAYPRTILLSVTVSHWLCLIKSKMKASRVALKS